MAAEPRNRSTGPSVTFGTEVIQLFVKTQNGKTITIEAGLSDSVRDVKLLISEKTDIASNEQRIVFEGRQLEDGYTLSDYNIQNESTLNLGGYSVIIFGAHNAQGEFVAPPLGYIREVLEERMGGIGGEAIKIVPCKKKKMRSRFFE